MYQKRGATDRHGLVAAVIVAAWDNELVDIGKGSLIGIWVGVLEGNGKRHVRGCRG
jgi:hypothetical protein